MRKAYCHVIIFRFINLVPRLYFVFWFKEFRMLITYIFNENNYKNEHIIIRVIDEIN